MWLLYALLSMFFISTWRYTAEEFGTSILLWRICHSISAFIFAFFSLEEIALNVIPFWLQAYTVWWLLHLWAYSFYKTIGGILIGGSHFSSKILRTYKAEQVMDALYEKDSQR